MIRAAKPGAIGVPYDCDSDDNLTVPAGGDYPGYEFHYFTFHLPPGAQSPRINFQALGPDDRAVVALNGQDLGNFASPATNQPHLGPSGAEARTFSILPGPDSWFDNPALFQTGTNVLRLWVNNTGSGGSGTARTHTGGGGASGSVVRGFLTYEYQEPPPPAAGIPTLSEWAQILLALLVLAAGGRHWRRRRG